MINLRDIIDISDIIWSVMMLRATPRRRLVGFGLVPRYVRKAGGVEGTLQDGVRYIHSIISIM